MELKQHNRRRECCSWVPVLALLVFILPRTALSAWVPVGPGGGLLVNDIAISPSAPATLYATATVTLPAGIWKTVDSGANWANLVPNVNFFGIGVKSNDPLTALAGPQPGAVLRTTNGSTFSTTSGSASHGAWVFGFSASTPATVYAGGFTDGLPQSGVLQKSTNSGASWTSFSIDGDATPPIRSIAVDPTNANIVYAGAQPDGIGANDGLYRSVNGGTSWTFLSGLNYTLVNALAIDPNDNGILFAGSLNLGEIKRSIDGGLTWSLMHDPFAAGGVLQFKGIGGIAVNPNNSAVVYAAGGGTLGTSRVIVSTDCGTSWSEVANAADLGAAVSLAKIVIDPVNNFVFVLEGFSSREIFRESLINTSTGPCPVGTPPGGGTPSATIAVANITADDIVDHTEVVGSINVTGSVGGDAAPGDTVGLDVNGNAYPGLVSGTNTFSIAVPGSDLVADSSIVATVSGTVLGNPFSAMTTSNHTVILATITVDNVTADDSVDVTEAAGPINVTGSVGGGATQGDSVNFSVNGNPYSGLVSATNTFSIAVTGADLAADTSFVAAVSGDVGGNPFNVSTTSTHLVAGSGNTTTSSIAGGSSSSSSFDYLIVGMMLILGLFRRIRPEIRQIRLKFTLFE